MMNGSAVQLTQVEREVLKLEIDERGCDVCIHSVLLTKGRLLCRSGLRFPYCRANKKKGFKLNDN